MSSEKIQTSAAAAPTDKDEIKGISPTVSTAVAVESPGLQNLTIVARGESLPESELDTSNVTGVDDAALLRARHSLTTAEEKKLIRRIDLRLLPLLSILYMVKTIDAANVGSTHHYSEYIRCVSSTHGFHFLQVSNARIMDRGTPHNILTELHVTSNQYNFVTTAYYVRRH